MPQRPASAHAIPSAPLPTPAEMAAWDKAAMALGMDGFVLMENAARAAMDSLLDACGPVAGKRVLCLAGPGNNGGDAVAMARMLHDAGAHVALLLAKPQNAYRAESGRHLRLAKACGITPGQLTPAALARQHPHIVVDGLLGAGFRPPLREPYPARIDWINAQEAFVLSLDMPSGLDGLSGRPTSPRAGSCVRADRTVSFQAAKTGLVQPEARPFVGELDLRPIGMPGRVMDEAPPAARLLDHGVFSLLPPRGPGDHKGMAGRVLVAGGSPGLTGAPFLAAHAALRAGAGLVAVACPEPWAAEAKHATPEIMTRPLDGPDWGPAMAAALEAEPCDALVLGPGLGRGAGARDFLAALLRREPPPTVLDADALHHLAELGGVRLSNSVITPHPGEAARLLESSAAKVQADRLGAARELAARFGCVSVLKGAATVVAAPGSTTGRSPVYISPWCEPVLAVGGAGDVLAGLLGALLADSRTTREAPQEEDAARALQAACLAVYWHGLSGRALARSLGQDRGVTAREIADRLPNALAHALAHVPARVPARPQPQAKPQGDRA